MGKLTEKNNNLEDDQQAGHHSPEYPSRLVRDSASSTQPHLISLDAVRMTRHRDSLNIITILHIVIKRPTSGLECIDSLDIRDHHSNSARKHKDERDDG